MARRELFSIIALLTIILLVTYVPKSASSMPNQNEIRVIVDMDAAPDDWQSILYLLKHPDVTVIGIGVSCGVSYVDTGVTNTLGLLEYLDIDDIPVAAGKETPLVTDHEFPTPWREASNNFYGLDLPTTTLQPSALNASDLIISLVENSESNVSLVALGPLTNLAIALDSEPTIKSKIDKILLMGGAIDVPGNVGLESDIPNYVAEWNIWVDPHAADIVFRSGLQINMVALDATNQVPQTQAFLDRLGPIIATPEAQLLYNMVSPGLYFWDQLTVVTLTDPEVAAWEEHCIEIVVDLENHEGMTNSTDTGCNNARVAMTADASLFEDLFIGYINGELPSSSTTSSNTSGTTTPVDPLVLITVGSGVVIACLIIIVAMKRR
ncbi:MAG: nucleoside hydrolase [Candidatus Thorarchaeota archaeon]